MSPSLAYKFRALPTSDEREDERSLHDTEPAIQKRSRQCLLLLLLALSVGINIIFTMLWAKCHKHGCSFYPQLTKTPVQDKIAYKTFFFGQDKGELIYEQNPSPAVDAAWKGLYDFSGSTVPGLNRTASFDEMMAFIKQRGNKIRLLDVFHQIHCLDTIRKALYPDYYHPIESKHIIHCVNSIRRSLVCMSDVSDVSWVWDHDFGVLVESRENIHTCRDFEKIKQWALENHYDRQFVGAPHRSS